jgi:hypothetical protein
MHFCSSFAAQPRAKASPPPSLLWQPVFAFLERDVCDNRLALPLFFFFCQDIVKHLLYESPNGFACPSVPVTAKTPEGPCQYITKNYQK